MIGLRETLRLIPDVKRFLSSLEVEVATSLSDRIKPHPRIADELSRAIEDQPPATIRDGNVIKPGYDKILDELRGISTNADRFLIDLENKEKKNAKAPGLKVAYNRVHGYYLEIPRSQVKNIPLEYQRTQTLKNSERFVTPELKQFGDKVSTAHEQALAKEKEIYQALLQRFHPHLSSLQTTAQGLAKADVLATLAWCAKRYSYERPRLSSEPGIEIHNGRHPVVERFLDNTDSGDFVPNDLILDKQRRMLIITGPNMGGKSTYMRQTAQIVLLAHIGAQVPAEKSIIGPVDRIFTRIGASDDIASGRSTFMVEMMETADILNNATAESLVLMDEIGRGTSTFDGLSLAWACAAQLAANNQSFTLFATHYFELTTLAGTFDNIHNVHLDALEHKDTIVFLHKVKKGAVNQSYGIQVAKLAGIPNAVIQSARKKLHQLEAQQLCEIQKADSSQLPLAFSNHRDVPEPLQNHPALEKLNTLDLNNISPKQALDLLYELTTLAKQGLT